MISKIDLPKMEGAKVYDNKGSCGALVNYLVANDDKLEGELFFNLERSDITPEEAKEIIDKNVKGLKRTETKFISLSINPSHEEIKHIGNDRKKMELYVKATMKNYADNFKNREVNSSDLVWTAVIHEHRYFTNKDKVVYEKNNKGLKFPYYTQEEVEKFKRNNPTITCPFEKEARKPGNNMHAHIIVSKRDRNMKNTLSPHGKKGTFKITEFQKNNQIEFQKIFEFKRGQNLYKEAQIETIHKFINDINDRKATFLDNDIVVKLVEKHNNPADTLRNLKQLNMDLYRSKNIDDPYRYLEVGKEVYWKENKPDKIAEKEDVKINKENDYGVLTSIIYEMNHMSNQMGNNNQSFSEDMRKRKHKRKNKL